jgi:hypothetical protein
MADLRGTAVTSWRGRTSALLVCVLALGLAPGGSPVPPAAASQTIRAQNGNPGSTTGTIVGTAWKADNTPLAKARVRLRDVTTGRGGAITTTDALGQFRFDRVEPGAYVVELLTDRDHVAAIGELFGLRPDDTITTVVRLGARATWFEGFFGNAAAAAIAAASSIGVTAVGSSGLPASPQ